MRPYFCDCVNFFPLKVINRKIATEIMKADGVTGGHQLELDFALAMLRQFLFDQINFIESHCQGVVGTVDVPKGNPYKFHLTKTSKRLIKYNYFGFYVTSYLRCSKSEDHKYVAWISIYNHGN